MAKKNKNLLLLSRIISRVFDPPHEILMAVLLAVYVAVKEGLRWRFLGVILFIDSVVPFIFFLTMLYNKQVSSWDIRKREERLPIYLFTMLCHLGGVWLAHELGKDELAWTLLTFWLTGITFAIITFFWKISLHAGVNAFLATLIVTTFGYKYIWVYSLVMIVMWARKYDKHHTWVQLLGGAGLGILGALLGIG